MRQIIKGVSFTPLAGDGDASFAEHLEGVDAVLQFSLSPFPVEKIALGYIGQREPIEGQTRGVHEFLDLE